MEAVVSVCAIDSASRGCSDDLDVIYSRCFRDQRRQAREAQKVGVGDD